MDRTDLAAESLPFAPAALDLLMPMHLVIDPDGTVRHAGPTAQRLSGGAGLVGRRFLDAFELRRPRAVGSMAELSDPRGVKLMLRTRDAAATPLKGLAVPLAAGAAGQEGWLMVNLAFGISAIDAIGRYALTASDFAITDATVELLYLVEANRAVLTESRNLNRRLQGAMIAAEEQAFTDTLTGLRNRRAMDHILERLEAARAAFALMHLDLDFFKDVNDSFGHAAGDQVLQSVARTLLSVVRDDDAVVRAGGDEFVLIFPGLTAHERLARIAARIIAGLERPIAVDRGVCRISGSIGIVTTADYGGTLPTVEQMLKDADAALYSGKRSGRARFVFARPNPASRREGAAPASRPSDGSDDASGDRGGSARCPPTRSPPGSVSPPGPMLQSGSVPRVDPASPSVPASPRAGAAAPSAGSAGGAASRSGVMLRRP